MPIGCRKLVQSVHDAGVSVQGMTVPEFEVDEDDWENHLIEEPE